MSIHMLTQDQVTAVEDYINALAEEYIAQEKEKAPRWWKFWKKIPTSRIHQVVQFMLKSIDGLIQFVEPIIPDGVYKKAIVLEATAKLFDFTVREIMTFWLRPFMPAIKSFVMNIMIANTIDFLVSKYNKGEMGKVEDGKENS